MAQGRNWKNKIEWIFDTHGDIIFEPQPPNFTLTRGGDCMNENIEKNELDEYI